MEKTPPPILLTTEEKTPGSAPFSPLSPNFSTELAQLTVGPPLEKLYLTGVTKLILY